MTKRVVLVRHGESEANAGELWQGATSSPLTEAGRDQAELLGARLQHRKFDMVASSDLERALHTARLAGYPVPLVDPGWREGYLGEWEGRPTEWVVDHCGDDLMRLQYDYDLPMGRTGETPRQVAERSWKSLTSLLEKIDEGGSGLVFAHGGVIDMILWRITRLTPGRRRSGFLSNGSLCELSFKGDKASILRYNDATHLRPIAPWSEATRREGGTVIDLIRHGVTHANLDGRVQGRLDSDLHPNGKRQARRLSSWVGDFDEIYSSPLARASSTAEIAFGQAPRLADDLMEISFGEWEGNRWKDLAAQGRLDEYQKGHDVRRGRTGETWAEAQARIEGFINHLARTHPGKRVAATSHGGVIRAYAARVLGLPYEKIGLLGHLQNTSVTQIAIAEDGFPTLATYNLAPHLED